VGEEVETKNLPWGILTFPVHASFIRLKITSVNKFSWILLITKKGL